MKNTLFALTISQNFTIQNGNTIYLVITPKVCVSCECIPLILYIDILPDDHEYS